MKYLDLLKLSNKFLEETSISKYCSSVCKGLCCVEYGCTLFPNTCETKLGCKLYLCGELIKMLNATFNTKEFDFFLGTNIARVFQPLEKSLGKAKDFYSSKIDFTKQYEYHFQKISSFPIKEELYPKIKKLFEFLTKKSLHRSKLSTYDNVFFKMIIKLKS
jgi:hypothetical protein